MRRYRRRPITLADFWFPLGLIAVASVVGFWTGQAHAQTCPAAPADPIPRDAARISWVAPTTLSSGAPIVGQITYTVYELVGTVQTLRCTTTLTSAGQTGLSAGTHTWIVTAKTTANGESAPSNQASKAITDPPNPPTNITVASTRIEPSEWTCRDAAGAILSSHTRQDTAQTACTNRAIASLGTQYEIRPSGYRIVAQ